MYYCDLPMNGLCSSIVVYVILYTGSVRKLSVVSFVS